MTAALDPIIHPALRLQACAVLAKAQPVAFSLLRAGLDVSESVLSKHIKALQAAGYVEVHKTTSDGRLRTWLSMTPAGHAAFAAHASALRALLGAG